MKHNAESVVNVLEVVKKLIENPALKLVLDFAKIKIKGVPVSELINLLSIALDKIIKDTNVISEADYCFSSDFGQGRLNKADFLARIKCVQKHYEKFSKTQKDNFWRNYGKELLELINKANKAGVKYKTHELDAALITAYSAYKDSLIA